MKMCLIFSCCLLALVMSDVTTRTDSGRQESVKVVALMRRIKIIIIRISSRGQDSSGTVL